MKNLSLGRSPADPCAGSNADGSDRKRRRLHAVSSDHLVQGPREWRDWANNLLPDLVDNISGRLLSHDVTEYLRFRAVCRPWRDLTDDPRASLLDARFRPRNWAVLTMTPDGSGRIRRHLLNLATGASLAVDLPSLATYCHLCAADGLLVLYDRHTAAIRLLDPLSNSVVDYPPITSVVDRALVTSRFVSEHSSGAISRKLNGAAFDDSTTPPTLVVCLRGGICNIVVARPGDLRWIRVNEGDAAHPMYSRFDRVTFHSLLAVGGRCYVSAPEGSVYLLELRPWPRLVELVNQRRLASPVTVFHKRIVSFLFRDDSGGGKSRVLMVRYWINMRHFAGKQGYDYNPKDLFTVRGLTSLIELLEVDLSARKLIPVRSLGCSAAFVGLTHCVLVSTETFPSITPDAIYFGCLHQDTRWLSVYHINRKRGYRRIEAPHEFTCDRVRGLVPGAQPCNLDQYLACYVDCVHSICGVCINHVAHVVC